MNRMDKLSLFNLVSSRGGVLGLTSLISDLFIAALGTFSKLRTVAGVSCFKMAINGTCHGTCLAEV